MSGIPSGLEYSVRDRRRGYVLQSDSHQWGEQGRGIKGRTTACIAPAHGDEYDSMRFKDGTHGDGELKRQNSYKRDRRNIQYARDKPDSPSRTQRACGRCHRSRLRPEAVKAIRRRCFQDHIQRQDAGLRGQYREHPLSIEKSIRGRWWWIGNKRGKPYERATLTRSFEFLEILFAERR